MNFKVFSLGVLTIFLAGFTRAHESPDEWMIFSEKASSSYNLTEEQERAIGPWLDLRTGGVAVGPSQSKDGSSQGSLANGSLLPKSGVGFRRVGDENESWGTGHMISLIENASAYFTKEIWPGKEIYVGGIAKQFGGKYGPHKSHQNGLDADILFVGNKDWKSVLNEKGEVTDRFDTEMNWAFWRSIFDQKIVENGKAISIVTMILVDPRIKTFLCDWGAKNNIFANPIDRELMTRIRPTEGHDDHMHIRIRCSPHHSLCVREWIPQDLGCDQAAP